MKQPNPLKLDPPPGRGVYCNRTLNLRSVRAIGYDMDYTLVHYHIDAWERRAFEYLRGKLSVLGGAVSQLTFDPNLVIRGLVIDRELGNLVKANRFGYVKTAAHGTQPMAFDEQRRVYSRAEVDLSDPRWVFLNTLFSLSEAVMYASLVDLLDEGRLRHALGYGDLYDIVRGSLDEAHLEGRLKADILARPDAFVVHDPEAPLALLDQRAAGKKLVLITNSDWSYTKDTMGYAFDPFLPPGMTWRDVFHVVITSSRKPDFFESGAPLYEVVSDDGLLRPCPGGLVRDGMYAGGNATQVEAYFDADSADVLYVGDHMYADVHASKRVRRWRTALVLRELEDELVALGSFQRTQERLNRLMQEKVDVEARLAEARLWQLRGRHDYAPAADGGAEAASKREHELRSRLAVLDERIGPLARQAGELHNRRWGLLMRTGNDKSHLAFQVERHADIYTSRVSNFLFETPFAYFRSPRGSLPHDPVHEPVDDSAAATALDESDLDAATHR